MIYFDNASTTKIFKDVAEFMCNYSQENFYNPSGIYSKSIKVFNDLENCRNKLRGYLGADDYQVIFTASATEANNIALDSFVQKNKKVLIGGGEHSSIYETAQHLRQQGFDVVFLHLTTEGKIDIEDLKNKLDDTVGFVSIMHVNNETGAINDIANLTKIVKSKAKNAIFHCDGVQAFCKINTNLKHLGVDAYTVSSHKIHGPRGVGALIIRKGLPIKTFVFGGGQEQNIRSGTENVAGVMAFVMAMEKMQKNLKANFEHARTLKTRLLQNLTDTDFVLNGNEENDSPYIVSLSFETKGEVLLHMLEEEEIFVSTGSSCNSKHKGNRVLTEMGKDKTSTDGNIRISFCEDNTEDEVDIFCKVLKEKLEKIKGLNIWKK